MQPYALRQLPLFIVALMLAAAPAQAEWFATLKLPYNSPGYLAQWENDPQQIVFTLNNHSTAPATIVLELVAKSDALGEIFHGTCVPFTMVNNSPRALRTPEVIRWKEIVWNPAVRGTLANPRRVPEGDLQVCVRVYEWKNGRGAQLAEACEKTNVNYPDVPQPAAPRSDAHVSGNVVQLTWQAPEVPAEIALQYRVEVATMSSGASPQDAIAHPEWSAIVRATNASVSWGKPLRRGGDYAWRVTALDQYGSPATAHSGNSRVVTFHFDPPDERETDRWLGRVQKSAVAALAPAKADPAAAALIAPAEAALNSGASSQACVEASAKLRTALDSLQAAGSPAAIDAIEQSLALTQWVADATEAGGTGPYDSLVTLCMVRAAGARRAASAPTQTAIDTLITQLKALRSSLATPSALVAANAAHRRGLSLVAAGKSESAVWHERMENLLFTSSALMRLPWPAGGALAEAEIHAMQVQRTAPKKSADQIGTLRAQLADALTQLETFAAAGRSVPEDVKMYDALRRALATAEGIRGAWKGSADGLGDLDSIKLAVNECVDVIVRSRSSNVATLYFMLARAQNSAGKKAAGDFDKAIAACRDALAQPANVVMQVQVIGDVKRTVLANAGKGDKAWTMIPVDWCDRALNVSSFAADISQLRPMIGAMAGGLPDATAKTSATALAAYCDDLVNRCVLADAASSFFHDLETPEVQRRIVVDLVRDLRELGRLGGAPAHDAAQRVEQALVKSLLERICLAGPEAADVRGEVEKRRLTCAFGKTTGNAFAEVAGTSLVINTLLADQHIQALVTLVFAALHDAPATVLSRYTSMLTSRDALVKAGVQGWNARADFLIDVGLLGEREVTGMLRAMP